MARCITPVTGCAADLLLLDCGLPVTDSPSLLQLCNFVRVRMTPVYTDGNTLQLNDAKGRPCVDQEGCGYLSKYDLEIEMCGISANATAWLTGDRTTENGGAAFGRRSDCAPIFSFRLWQELAGSGRKNCVDGEPEYLLHWLPCVTNFRLSGDFEVAEDVVTRQTLTATAYANDGAFGNGYFGEYTYSDLTTDPAAGTVAGQAYDEEIHMYEVVADPAPPDCPEDCSLVDFVGAGGIDPDGKVAGARTPPPKPTPPKELVDA